MIKLEFAIKIKNKNHGERNMKEVNIVIKYNKAHIAATYALLASVIANKNKESKYRIWINIAEMDSDEFTLRTLQNNSVHVELFTDNNILRRSLKRVICLQWNTIVQGDLSDLYEFDMKGNAVAETLNIPDVISNIPVSAEKHNSAVKLVDFSSKADNQSVMELPIYYNMAYDQILQYPEIYDKEELKEITGLEKLDMNKLKKKAVILRYAEDYSPEQYFDHPYAEQWTKYLFRSNYDMTEMENRMAYQETLGNLMKRDEMKRIPVSFYLENNETAYAVALINSIASNLSEDRKLDIRILHHGVSEEHKRMLQQMNSDKINIVLHDVKVDKREHAVLLVPQIFYNCEKVIWLNSKMICYGDISDLFEQEISNDYLCATEGKVNLKKADDAIIADEICLENTVYPDMAVVLINVQKWIADDIVVKVRYMLKSKRNFQKAVYTVCKNHIDRISHRWNYSENGKDAHTYLNQCSIYNYINGMSPWLNKEENISEDMCRYLLLHSEYEKLREEILKYESGEEEDVKEVMEKIEKLEKQNADLTAEKNALKQKNELLQKQNEMLDQQKEQFLYELLETRKSFTYKVGRFITFVPRHLRGDK